jgi:hypothetical protein
MAGHRSLVVSGAFGLVALAIVGTAGGAATDAYVHTLLTPPRCAPADGTPDLSQPVCSVGFFGPIRQALTSQAVIVTFLDEESSQADCAAAMAGVETVATVDDVPVGTTTVGCRFVPHAVDNLATPVIPGWVYDIRYVVSAGSLTPGTHTLGVTDTYRVDVSYSLGCDDPSGRCTHHAGDTFSFTKSLVITG